jgi:DNA (cytosine-5)-methyltransferase 1
MNRPLLLDLFCNAGGAGAGYWRAGFDVVGVDIVDQPRYPFAFVRADALAPPVRLEAFAAVHASPPCQWGTRYRRKPGQVRPAANMVAEVRALLEAIGLPYVIEQPRDNLAALEADRVVVLDGSMFALDVLRARAFESNMPWPALLPVPYRGAQTPRFPHATNRVNLRRTIEVGVWRIPLEVQRRAMGIEWASLAELSQAVPPVYTEWIGEHLLSLEAVS